LKIQTLFKVNGYLFLGGSMEVIRESAIWFED